MKTGRHTKKDLEAARGYIEQYGWIQGKPGSVETGFCLIGALDHHVLEVEHDGNWNRLAQDYHGLGALYFWELSDWNDEPGRTKEEVIERLTTAIEGL